MNLRCLRCDQRYSTTTLESVCPKCGRPTPKNLPVYPDSDPDTEPRLPEVSDDE